VNFEFLLNLFEQDDADILSLTLLLTSKLRIPSASMCLHIIGKVLVLVSSKFSNESLILPQHIVGFFEKFGTSNCHEIELISSQLLGMIHEFMMQNKPTNLQLHCCVIVLQSAATMKQSLKVRFPAWFIEYSSSIWAIYSEASKVQDAVALQSQRISQKEMVAKICGVFKESRWIELLSNCQWDLCVNILSSMLGNEFICNLANLLIIMQLTASFFLLYSWV
jgi:hypothetical protein